MGGPTITPAQYAALSDWDILHVYLAPRDEDGSLVPLRQRFRDAAGDSGDDEEAELSGDPIAALSVPREALLLGATAQFCAMFFAVWRRRGLPEPEILEKYREQLRLVPPLGHYHGTLPAQLQAPGFASGVIAPR